MRSRKSGILILIAAIGLGLGGCNSPVMSNLSPSVEPGAQPVAVDPSKANTPKVGDELEEAKQQFRDRNFGLAESKFRAIVEQKPNHAEAWLGLGAAYDQLRRFELADRAYEQVRKIAGPSVALYNNRGYSYLLRGDRRRARVQFAAARRLDPTNEFVSNNQRILEKRN